MRLSIDKDKFVESALRGPVPPLGAEFPYAAPNSVYPLFSGPMSLLFQSVKGPPVTARYSFIGFDPYAVIKVAGGDVEVLSGDKSTHSSGKPLSRIRELLGCYVQSPDPALPPFQGGAAGLLSYDFVHYLELLPKTTADDLRIPDAHILMLDRLIAFDHLLGRAWAVLSPGAREAEAVPGGPGAAYWAEKYDEAEANAAAIINRLGKARPDAGAYMSPQGGRGSRGAAGAGGA